MTVAGAKPSAEFWAGRRVFLTGHTGFKGSWLAIWLQQMGAELSGYALAPQTTPSLFIEADVARGMSSRIGDVRDHASLLSAMKQAAPEVVIHMAAQPLVRHSYTAPVETYATNVMGTVHLLECVRQCPDVRAVVNVTTDKCYENREWHWGYREDEPMGGHDPYSSSKACAELVTAAYRKSFFSGAGSHRAALASARAGNVIGGGDWAVDRLIPDFIRAISARQAVRIRNPLAIRPWQHVLEPLSGYLVLAEHLYTDGQAFAEGWNFGPSDSDARNVEWIVRRLTECWGGGAAWTKDDGTHPHEATYLKLDCSRARARLNWHPRWNLETALERIVDWHKAHIAGRQMRQLCDEQICEYMDARVSDMPQL